MSTSLERDLFLALQGLYTHAELHVPGDAATRGPHWDAARAVITRYKANELEHGVKPDQLERERLIAQLTAVEKHIEERKGSVRELVYQWVLLDHQLIALNCRILQERAP